MKRQSVLLLTIAITVVWVCGLSASAAAQDRVTVDLTYAAPGTGPAPNFSPKGTQVPLIELPAGAALPDGAVRPAKTGQIKIGPSEKSWVPVLATADPANPEDLCRLYVDRNRNGNFTDDGPALTATPAIREKTGDAWSSFNRIEVTVPYGQQAGRNAVEPYMFNVWIVRAKGAAAPDVLRYSVASWRTGQTKVKGIDALVAMMDGNNDALYDAQDSWSVIEAAGPDAPKRVLSHVEARPTERMMFVAGGPKELVLVFRAASPDGRSLTFEIVNRAVTKAADRAGDDSVAAERSRARATTPFVWQEGEKALDAALKQARVAGKRVILDYWATWCGPCKSMDEWIWTDAEVAGLLNGGFFGVRLDGDIEKKLVERFKVAGYPTVVILDGAGKELARFSGYLGSKEVLGILNGLK